MTELRDSEDQPARVGMNKAAWRGATIACLVIALGLVAALLAQAGLWGGGSKSHPEPLTTLALVLAILAFLVQLFVFVFQSNASSRAIQRSEELNAKTHGALDKIEANSAATQKVLFSQFDRLLDYIVGVRPTNSDSRQEQGEDEDLVDVEESEAEDPLTLANVKPLVEEAFLRASRPVFSVQTPSAPSDEDRAIHAYIASWPPREEAEAIVEKLQELSPLAFAAITRLAYAEKLQRIRGERLGLQIGAEHPDGTVRELIDAKLVHILGKRATLTDEGRRIARMLPIGKGRPIPAWADDVLEPLGKPALTAPSTP